MKLSFFVSLLLLAGCNGILAPITIVVAEKDEQSRLEWQSRGLATTSTGRVVEAYRYVVVHEFWVKSVDGRWYRVDEPTWRGAETGKPLTIDP